MTTPSRFEALSIIEGVHFSQKFDVFHLVTVVPINDGRLRRGLAVAADAMLSDAGWSARLGQPWLDAQARNVPAFVLHAGLPGDTIEEALRGAQLLADIVADVVTIHRDAPASVVLTVVEEVTSTESPRPFMIRSAIETYHGNLLSGVISGEDPAAIAHDINAAAKHPLSLLWLRMARQARAERNPDFAVFRWWSLLESVAGQGPPSPRISVTDFDGAPLLKDDGKPVTTATSHGLVFELVKKYYRDRNIHESAYVMNPPFVRLWETVLAWAGLRNAIAHYGRFDLASKEQQAAWWFPFVAAARERELSLPGQPAHLLQLLRGLTTDVVRWAIDRAAMQA